MFNMDTDTLPIPIDLLLKLFNSLPQQSSVRTEVLEFLRTYKSNYDPKAHMAEGFRLKEDNELVFDESLYDEAVYRGKIETYTETVKEKVKKIRNQLEILKHMGESHVTVVGALSPSAIKQRVGEGLPVNEEQVKLLSMLSPLLLTDGKKNEA